MIGMKEAGTVRRGINLKSILVLCLDRVAAYSTHLRLFGPSSTQASSITCLLYAAVYLNLNGSKSNPICDSHADRGARLSWSGQYMFSMS